MNLRALHRPVAMLKLCRQSCHCLIRYTQSCMIMHVSVSTLVCIQLCKVALINSGHAEVELGCSSDKQPETCSC